MRLPNFNGCGTAIVTPFKNGEIDYGSLKKLIEFQIKEGIHFIVVCGTTGEAPTLSHEEQIAVIKFVVKIVDGRAPVIAGAGSNSTQEAIALSRDAEAAGADALLSVVPYYNKPSQEGIYQHFMTIAKSVDLPIFLYNVPGRTVINMTPDTVARLSEIPSIIGIKEACGDLQQISEIIRICPDDFIVLSGDDPTAMFTVLAGGKGVISVTSNVLPSLMSRLMEHSLRDANKFDRNNLIYDNNHLLPIMRAMFYYPSPAPAKKALQILGVITSDEVRLPMTSVPEKEAKIIKRAMSKARVLPSTYQVNQIS